MKILKIKVCGLLLALSGIFAGCDNPLKDIDLQVSTEVIQHHAVLQVVDSKGENVTGAAVALVDGETAVIYNLAGRKDFKLLGGNMVTFGVDPNRKVSGEAPVEFRVRITAPGFKSREILMSITDVDMGIRTITMFGMAEQVEGAVATVKNVDLQENGATPVPTNVSGDAGLALDIDAGTQFKNAQGQVMTGGAVKVEVVSIDATKESATALLPEGDLRSSAVLLEGGRTAAGAFSPVAMTEINMAVNNVGIRSFTKPIQVKMPIRAEYVSPATGAPIAAGQLFELYSNSADGIWRFEKQLAVQGTAQQGYYVEFETDHLSFYMAGKFAQACDDMAKINFSASWMQQGLTLPVQVQAIWNGQIIASSRSYSISEENRSISLSNLPADDVTLVVRNSEGNIIAEAPLAACGKPTEIQLPNSIAGPVVTLQLYVRCPNKSETITVLPTFQMFYRVSGTETFKVLGTVKNGFLRTSLLKTDGTEYDFKAVWNDRVKIVNRKTVLQDNNATVGIKPGDVIGSKDGATNLEILTEECNKL